MNNKEFFNSVAYKWDDMCHHSDSKIRKIINLSYIKEGAKILDIGTGTGILISYLLEKYPKEIVALDIAENMIEVAKSKYKEENLRFVVNDILDFTEGDFDYIFIYSAYPHFPNKDKLINHLSKLLKSGGKLIIAHSDSKEKINKIHANKEEVKEDRLLPAVENAKTINRYLNVDKIIDNEEMYYISSVL